MHYLSVLTESKSVQKCRSYSRATLSLSNQNFCMKIDGIFKNCSCFIDYRLCRSYTSDPLHIFLWKLVEFLRIAHVSSTIGSYALSDPSFAFDKRPYCTTWLRYQNQNLFKNVGIINDWPFLYRHFCMKIDRIFKELLMFHRL